MLIISFSIYTLLRIVSKLNYSISLYPQQIKANALAIEFMNHPAYEAALKVMPDDLESLFFRANTMTTNTLKWYEGILASQDLIVFSIFLFLGPILVLLAVVINRYITSPMQKLTQATRQLAQGNFSTRADLNTRSWDNYSLALAQDFNSMATALERLESERRSMIADIAHELRTPITAIQLQLEAVQDGIEPLDRELINRLHGETKLLSSLIIDLRTLSLAEARKLTLNQQFFNLYEFIEKLVARFGAPLRQKNIELTLKGSKDIFLYADVERINQVLNNLFSNAVRHTSEEGTISICFDTSSEGVILDVINSDSALSEEELSHIFNRFYRSGKGKVREEGGSGLGLAISKALVELHGGTISAENDSGNSIKFSVFLPFVRDKA